MATEPSPKLTVYSREYCHLCEELIDALSGLQAQSRFEFEVVDVDADPELERSHGDSVPVLAHDGVELCHGRLDRDRVTAYLAQFL